MNPDHGLNPRDRDYLERTRILARRGWGAVHPNPMVGCVLVRDGEVVAEGWHQAFGGPHAEIVALEEALSAAEGATAYVSLEPCDHHGKTPPCSQALIQAGVRRVVFGAADPGVESGGGARTLREAGVEVLGPVWSEAQGRAENPAFFHVARHEAPFVALKLAMTLDARIAATAGTETAITGTEAQEEVHRLRSGFDAIMVGGRTALVDDPRLTVRLAPAGRVPPRRLVLSPAADLPEGAALFQDVQEAPVHVFTRLDASESAMERLEAAGAVVHPVAHRGSALELGAVSDVAWELGIRSILCEGGGRLASSLLTEDRVQRLYLFVAPRTLGPGGVPAFPDGDRLDWSAFRPAVAPATFGDDTLIVLDRQGGG
ncbi:MAG: bifunctional diaminohydroxyphosphoribosylaminopyrimidine deaminase/5-amino-6-(5-phosphoribosylamino)uracil reductase RibD [Longimicrobiales bacterium]|nr:bifunctional diaminohydroxyphosphoribosylaminopyrimidine deaminase/5-amino-6-(5-phosphoribosylamino)uracil reductase RibD [Longimicrobiales bacterium]